MKNNDISRRNFLNLSVKSLFGAGAGLLLPQLSISSNNAFLKNLTESKVTAEDVIDRIKKNVGVPWREKTVDVIKAGGNPKVVVTGITTTFMASLEVLQKSVATGKNFIISHEPIFWNNLDSDEGLTNDPVYQHKLDYIQKHHLVVFRFHDHWHARRPDGISEGFYKETGWDGYQYDKTRGLYELPETTTLEDFAQEIKSRLVSDSVRVVGDPKLKVKTVSQGGNKIPGSGARPPVADVIVVYEPDRENDVVEWFRDSVLADQQKGYIIVSHNRLEEAGMENCANWVRTFIPEVPVEFIPSGDPFWRTV